MVTFSQVYIQQYTPPPSCLFEVWCAIIQISSQRSELISPWWRHQRVISDIVPGMISDISLRPENKKFVIILLYFDITVWYSFSLSEISIFSISIFCLQFFFLESLWFRMLFCYLYPLFKLSYVLLYVLIPKNTNDISKHWPADL